MDPFKICSKCAYTWDVRDNFLKDSSICLVGFQASSIESEFGYYLFNHVLEHGHCNTTLAVEVEAFMSLYRGTRFTDIQYEGPMCEGHCTRVDDLAQCPVECRNAIARKVMQDFSRC